MIEKGSNINVRPLFYFLAELILKVNFSGMKVKPSILSTNSSPESGELGDIVCVALISRGCGFHIEGVAYFYFLVGFIFVIVG